MKRQQKGKYVVGNHPEGGEYRAFIPSPLPPNPPLKLSGSLGQSLIDAALALGRLDAVSDILPDEEILLSLYARKEAVLSSRIEDMQSSLSDLLLYEQGRESQVPADAPQVAQYVKAMHYGLQRLDDGFPLANRLLREMHGILLRGDTAKMPGEFRNAQVWIGGTHPGNARFVPPPPAEVENCMAALEGFLNLPNNPMHALLQAAVVHIQFETIHPFLDGNGRVGRLLITLLLCRAKVIRQPLLYVSLFFMQNRQKYYDSLNQVRESGDWEEWLAFFLRGIETTASAAVSTAHRLKELVERDRETIENEAGRRAGSVLRILDALMKSPLQKMSTIRRNTQLSIGAADHAMQWLVDKELVREITRQSRNRVFVYGECLDLLNEGIE